MTVRLCAGRRGAGSDRYRDADTGRQHCGCRPVSGPAPRRLGLWLVAARRAQEGGIPVVDMVRLAEQRARWQAYEDVTPTWFRAYLPLEAAARLIRTYEVQFVPGLLQTPDYARAVMRLGHAAASAQEVERRVALRTYRQQLLDRDGAPQLWAVLDEAALRRPIGGARVMRDQIAALIEMSRRPTVRIQVVPFAAGGHAAAGGAFSLLYLADTNAPDVVYVERLTGAVYLHDPREVEQYTVAMDRLAEQAEPPQRSAEILQRMLREADV